MSALLQFYRGEGTDDRGRTLAEIQAWDDVRLEAVHDFVQWLFPLPERSAFNASAPLLTAEDIAAFQADPKLRDALRASFVRMLRFYGFGFHGNPPSVELAPDAEARRRAWLIPGNHNYLRITRILRCLSLLGLRAEAGAFLGQLETIYTGEAGPLIGARTLDFWRAALR